MAPAYTVEQLRRRILDGTASDTVVRHLDLRSKEMIDLVLMHGLAYQHRPTRCAFIEKLGEAHVEKELVSSRLAELLRGQFPKHVKRNDYDASFETIAILRALTALDHPRDVELAVAAFEMALKLKPEYHLEMVDGVLRLLTAAEAYVVKIHVYAVNALDDHMKTRQRIGSRMGADLILESAFLYVLRWPERANVAKYARAMLDDSPTLMAEHVYAALLANSAMLPMLAPELVARVFQHPFAVRTDGSFPFVSEAATRWLTHECHNLRAYDHDTPVEPSAEVTAIFGSPRLKSEDVQQTITALDSCEEPWRAANIAGALAFVTVAPDIARDAIAASLPKRPDAIYWRTALFALSRLGTAQEELTEMLARHAELTRSSEALREAVRAHLLTLGISAGPLFAPATKQAFDAFSFPFDTKPPILFREGAFWLAYVERSSLAIGLAEMRRGENGLSCVRWPCPIELNELYVHADVRKRVAVRLEAWHEGAWLFRFGVERSRIGLYEGQLVAFDPVARAFSIARFKNGKLAREALTSARPWRPKLEETVTYEDCWTDESGALQHFPSTCPAMDPDGPEFLDAMRNVDGDHMSPAQDEQYSRAANERDERWAAMTRSWERLGAFIEPRETKNAALREALQIALRRAPHAHDCTQGTRGDGLVVRLALPWTEGPGPALVAFEG